MSDSQENTENANVDGTATEGTATEGTATEGTATEGTATDTNTEKTGVSDFEAALAFIESGVKKLGEAAKAELVALAKKYL